MSIIAGRRWAARATIDLTKAIDGIARALAEPDTGAVTMAEIKAARESAEQAVRGLVTAETHLQLEPPK